MKNLTTTFEQVDRQPHYLRLSRIGDQLSAMLSELHSYKCEPCTPDMHEQYLELDVYGKQLKRAIDKTASRYNDVIDTHTVSDNEIGSIISQYQDFQKHISDYLAEAVIHH